MKFGIIMVPRFFGRPIVARGFLGSALFARVGVLGAEEEAGGFRSVACDYATSIKLYSWGEGGRHPTASVGMNK